ncbi:MAG TPA: flagellar basal body L-ring protein FlgH [Burkholderiales bacterium]|jgi:flagellar L-ring protein precursor FlgH
MKTAFFRLTALVGVAFCFAACTPLPKVEIGHPTTAKPVAPAIHAQGNGAIYQAASYRPLFEDARPRYIGDILTITINENLTASTQKASAVSKTGSTSTSATNVDAPVGLLQGLKSLSVNGGSSTTFDGKGSSNANNSFTGSISVTVIDTLANGNLVVAGEKQLGTNTEVEFIRFSGVVNPRQIQPGNIVSSTQVADARIEMRGQGQTDEAAVMAWLGRFFMNFLPF